MSLYGALQVEIIGLRSISLQVCVRCITGQTGCAFHRGGDRHTISSSIACGSPRSSERSVFRTAVHSAKYVTRAEESVASVYQKKW